MKGLVRVRARGCCRGGGWVAMVVSRCLFFSDAMSHALFLEFKIDKLLILISCSALHLSRCYARREEDAAIELLR
jgi:hypothetical protein